MAKVGVANLKWKTVDLFAFTGEVVNESSQDHIEVHTQTFDNGQAFGQRSQTSVTTTRWTTVYLRNAAGEEMDAVLKDAKVRFPVGQTATLVWGRDIGAQLGPKIALFNNSTGQRQQRGRGIAIAGPAGGDIGRLGLGFQHGKVEQLKQAGIAAGQPIARAKLPTAKPPAQLTTEFEHARRPLLREVRPAAEQADRTLTRNQQSRSRAL